MNHGTMHFYWEKVTKQSGKKISCGWEFISDTIDTCQHYLDMSRILNIGVLLSICYSHTKRYLCRT